MLFLDLTTSTTLDCTNHRGCCQLKININFPWRMVKICESFMKITWGRLCVHSDVFSTDVILKLLFISPPSTTTIFTTTTTTSTCITATDTAPYLLPVVLLVLASHSWDRVYNLQFNLLWLYNLCNFVSNPLESIPFTVQHALGIPVSYTHLTLPTKA